MASNLTDLINAIVTVINAGSFTTTVTAVKGYSRRVDVETLAAMAVTVRPAGFATSFADRGYNENTLTSVEIVIQLKLSMETGAISPANVESLFLHLEEMVAWLSAVAAIDGATLQTLEAEPLLDPEHLADFGVGTIPIVATYSRGN